MMFGIPPSVSSGRGESLRTAGNTAASALLGTLTTWKPGPMALQDAIKLVFSTHKGE